MERRKANLLYLLQHLAAALVAGANAFLQEGARGEARKATLRLLLNAKRGSKSQLEAQRAVVDPAWDGNVCVGYIVVTLAVGLEKGKAKAMSSRERELSMEAVTRRKRRAQRLFGPG